MVTDTENLDGLPLRVQGAFILMLHGFTGADVARCFGIRREAVAYYRRRYGKRISGLTPSARKEALSVRFDSMVHRALNHVTSDKLQSASAVALATAAGICTDKAQRLREEIANETARSADIGAYVAQLAALGIVARRAQ